MAVSKGKPFEEKLSAQLREYDDSILVERLHDQMTGFINVSKNPSDFIVYKYPYMIYLECKSVRGASIPKDNLVQLERMEERCTPRRKGVLGVFVIWFIDHKCTFWIDHRYIRESIDNGLKSFNYEVLMHTAKFDERVKLIPATYPRVYGKYNFEEIL